MGLTYFKRYRMDRNLDEDQIPVPDIGPEFELLPFRADLLKHHATAKFESFRREMDVNVFPSLGRMDGCLRLMRDITGRNDFVPQATWLVTHRRGPSSPVQAVATVQGLMIDGWGAIQNLGVAAPFRGQRLGTLLLARAALGFLEAGVRRMHLEVTVANTSAIRLYERLGFRRARTVYKAVDVAGSEKD
ncbi:MAG: GNAT family N-acetyltransferase [Planctomycetota bacterium]